MRSGRPVIEQGHSSRANGTPGEQHIVHQHDGAAVDLERDRGRLDLRMQADALEVVAIKADVEETDVGDAEIGREALGDPAPPEWMPIRADCPMCGRARKADSSVA